MNNYKDTLSGIFHRIMTDEAGIREPYFSGTDEAGFAKAHETAAAVSIRLNPRKPVSGFQDLQQVPWCAKGVYLPSRPVFTLDPLFHAGVYYVQEASSMFAGYAFEHLVQGNDRAPVRVLDLCAAPGGKSTLLASLLKEQDLLVANEVIQTRASILSENLTRWGQANTWVTNNDPRDFGRLKAYFDCMLIDAPCTGSGLWRKDPGAIEEWSDEHVRLCSERQKRIIADALPALKDGGILLYATCSYSPEENELIADWICNEFDATGLTLPVPSDWGIRQTSSPQYAVPGYRFYPWEVKGEGFFLAAFRIGNAEAASRPSKSDKRRTKATAARWGDWLNTDMTVLEKNDASFAVYPEHTEDHELLSSYLRLRKGGIRLGKALQKDIIPDHELALSIHLSNVPHVSLDKEEALQYLKKEEIRKEGLKGWYAVKYQGQALGWGKWMPGGRMNNYLPKNWRIRMDV